MGTEMTKARDEVRERPPLRLESARRCVVTRAVLPKTQLLRFVVDPTGVLVPDLPARLPGRGLWLTCDRGVLEQAIAKNIFSRVARTSVRVPDGLVERVEASLVARFLDRLGLARRAGQAVAGFDQARAMLRAGRAGLLIEACDGAADGRRKLAGLAQNLSTVALFTGAALGSALGRAQAVHVAVATGRFSDDLASDASRLIAFRRAGQELH
jgi:predicted RNA-binding protein YlxR (DUF448 family)